MKWDKLGLIYSPDGDFIPGVTHGANPIAEHISGDDFRIYFSCRDERNRSSIASIEVVVSMGSISVKKGCSPQLVLGPGDLGMHDDCGVSIGCILSYRNRRFLYYMGWNLAVTVPWKNAIGVAVSGEGGETFERVSRFPTIPLSEVDPYTISYPWVIHTGEGKLRMWYGSNLQWGPAQMDMRHVLKHAESNDGVDWHRNGEVVLGFKNDKEYAICKPCVILDGDLYRMWFCARGDLDRETYRICYAESKDGINWLRDDDHVGIDVSESGWDSEMIEYPSVFDHKGERYLLYCGNKYGVDGFGGAVLRR